MSVGDIARAAMVGGGGGAAVATGPPPPTMPPPFAAAAAANNTIISPPPPTVPLPTNPASSQAVDVAKRAWGTLYNSWMFKYVALFIALIVILIIIKPPFVRVRTPLGAQDDSSYDPPCSPTRIVVVATIAIATAAMAPYAYDHWGSIVSMNTA
jgi:hypothetical protein